MNKTLKEIVFDLMKKGKCYDQNLFDEYNKYHPNKSFSLMSVENYKGQYRRLIKK